MQESTATSSTPVLYLMLGYPGAGKTTAAKLLEELTGAQRLSSDELRLKLFRTPQFTQHEHDELYRRLDRQLVEVMQTGGGIVYDANLNRYRHRREKYDLAERHGYQVKLLWLQTPRDLAKTRRIEEVTHHHLVPPNEDPASMFERLIRLFEPPRDDEHAIILDGTQLSADYLKAQLGL